MCAERERERERELPTLRKLIMLKFTLLAAVDVNRWNRLAQLFLDSALRIVNLCRRRRRRRHVTHNQNLKWSTAINARQCGELSIIVARRFTVVILVLPYALLNEKKPCFVFLLLTLSTPHYCSLYPRPPLAHSPPPSSCCPLHPTANLANTSHYKRSKPGSFFFFASTKKNFKLPLPTPILLHEVTQQQQQQQHQQRRQLVQHFSLSSFSFSVCFLSTYLLSVTYVPILS